MKRNILSVKKCNEKTFSLVVDGKLRVKSCSDEFSSVWGSHEKETGPRLLHEMIPLGTSALESIKSIFHNGKPINLKGIALPCPYGVCEATLSIHPVNSRNASLGAVVQMTPAFICHKAGHIAADKNMEEIRTATTTLAHGVRNPLNAIKGAVVYIREKYTREKNLVKFIHIIEEEINRLDTFIAHYLSASVTRRSIERVDVNSILNKIEILTSFQVQSHGIQANFQYGDIGTIKINPFLLEQAILNVINNAVEAMSRKGRLRVRTEAVNRAGKHYVLIEISDTGGGIAKTPSVGQGIHDKGRGFGLLITYEVLRSVQGHLEISSKGGKGTSVRMYFPCIQG
jgi:two-component system nitrogen regulation sensor histidine kinase GlnL